MLKKKLIFIFLLLNIVAHTQQLEEEIYQITESFIENQNPNSFQLLKDKTEKIKLQITSKDEQLAFVFLLCNKGYYLKSLDRVQEAISSYEDARKRYIDNNLSGYDIIEYCLKPLGELYTVSKDYSNAENTIRYYSLLAEKEGNQMQVVASIINLSIVYQMEGRHTEVIGIISSILNNSGLNPEQRQKLINIQTDSQFALDQVSNLAEIPKSNTYNYFLKKSQLGLIIGDFQEAETNFEKGEKLFFLQKNITARQLAKHYLKKSELFLNIKKTDEALNSLSLAMNSLLPNFNGTGIPLQNELYKENTFIDIFDLYGHIQSDFNKALEYYDLSFFMADLISEDISSQETKLLNQTDNRTRSEKCIELLFDRYEKTKEVKFISRAFQYAENSKATVLKEMLQKKSLLQLHPEDEILKKEQLLLQEQEFLINELVNERFEKKRVAVLNNLWVEYSKNAFDLKAIKIEISKKYPGNERHQLSIEALQGQLKKDKATLVEYFYGKKAIYQFAFNGNQSYFSKIKLNDEIEEDVSGFIDFFNEASVINNNVKNYTEHAYKTYQVLHLDTFSSTENLLIIPDGLLNFVPFEALISEPTGTSSFSKMPFLLKRQKIIYNSSAEFYLKKSTKQKRDKRLLGFFPVFEDSNQPLKYSIEEGKAIENNQNSTLLWKDEATKSSFKNRALAYEILHFSTHASSGDFNTPAYIEFYDGEMLLNELYTLNLNPELVVLSACETGVGKLFKGEGAMSIARGFQYAGAQNVLFSLWKINDQSTSKIMRSFYQEYNRHASLYMANHNSKIAYLEDESIGNSSKSPYYWSAFMYYGKLNEPHTVNYILYIGIGLFVILLVVIYKNRKRVNRS